MRLRMRLDARGRVEKDRHRPDRIERDEQRQSLTTRRPACCSLNRRAIPKGVIQRTINGTIAGAGYAGSAIRHGF